MIGYADSYTTILQEPRLDTLELSRKFVARRTRRRTMGTSLAELFSDVEVISSKGSLQTQINSIVIDSRRASPGCLFFALPGLRSDGSLYIDEAINRGAVAVVLANARQLVPTRVTFLQVRNPRAVLARVSRRFFRFPDEDLELIGITGTNGKSTIAHIVKHLLSGEGRIGLIGTINYDLGQRTVPSFKTTPEAVDLLGMLSQIRGAGCRTAVMEVSSHGIDQLRVKDMKFAAVAFTNLTGDHLDYHKDLDEYFAVKSRLFTGESGPLPEAAAINLDDPCGRKLVDRIPSGVRVVTFGVDSAANVRAVDIAPRFDGAAFKLVWPGGEAHVETRLLGGFNISNLLCSFALCYARGRNLHELLPRMATLPGIPGRMEAVENNLGCNVLVDYAHTDDALRNALGMLRAITPGRVLVVFGCGGDRDRSKRARMTAAVQEGADLAWATADNPRKESQARIFEDMKEGVTDHDRIAFIDDRRRAISLALDAARPGDSLLIAGKGHEPYQEFGDTVVPFDDRLVARELLAIKKMKPSR